MYYIDCRAFIKIGFVLALADAPYSKHPPSLLELFLESTNFSEREWGLFENAFSQTPLFLHYLYEHYRASRLRVPRGGEGGRGGGGGGGVEDVVGNSS